MNRRQKFRQSLSPLYLPLYDALCVNLSEEWGPYQGFRTGLQQHNIYLIGRVGPPRPTVTKADSMESAHCYGCATDWTIWEGPKPIWIPASDSKWKEYHQAIDKVGLRSGVEWGDIDHNELKIKASWKNVVMPYYEKYGMDTTQLYLKGLMI